MARIFRKDIYDLQTLPTFEDYVIGTDPEDSNRTRNFRIADLAALIGGSATTFIALTDTPIDYTGQAGNVVLVNGTEDGLEFGVGGGGASTFLTLTDTPSTFVGQSLLMPRVNVGETAIEFTDDYVTQTTQQLDISGFKLFTSGGANPLQMSGGFAHGMSVGNGSASTNGYIQFLTQQAGTFNNSWNPNSFQGTEHQYRIGINGGDWILQGGGTGTATIIPYTRLDQSNYTAHRTQTWQDKDGTIAHLSDLITESIDGSSRVITTVFNDLYNTVPANVTVVENKIGDITYISGTIACQKNSTTATNSYTAIFEIPLVNSPTAFTPITVWASNFISEPSTVLHGDVDVDDKITINFRIISAAGAGTGSATLFFSGVYSSS